jgi:hypothetical protein
MTGIGEGSSIDGYFVLRFTDEFVFLAAVGAALVFPVVPWLKQVMDRQAKEWLSRPLIAVTAGRTGSVAAVIILFVLCAAKLASGTYNPFIYFRF